MSDGLEAQRGIILHEVVVESADNPWSHHVIVHQARAVSGKKERAVHIAGHCTQYAGSIRGAYHGGDL